MALIDCPDCGRRVSDKAVSCPNCGRPVEIPHEEEESDQGQREPSGRGAFLFFVLTFIAIAGVVVYFGLEDTGVLTPKPKLGDVYQDKRNNYYTVFGFDDCPTIAEEVRSEIKDYDFNDDDIGDILLKWGLADAEKSMVRDCVWGRLVFTEDVPGNIHVENYPYKYKIWKWDDFRNNLDYIATLDEILEGLRR